MKYEKPAVEIINIENEDIVTDSNGIRCGQGAAGSANCLDLGIQGAPNSAAAMGCSGTGNMSGCRVSIGGVSCNVREGHMYCAGTWAGSTGVCIGIGTSADNPNCDQYIGAN